MNKAILADRIALPFWIILMIYAIYEITHGNPRAWIVLIIIGIAFIVDLTLVIKNWGKKRFSKISLKKS
jgi:hypothetical protein